MSKQFIQVDNENGGRWIRSGDVREVYWVESESLLFVTTDRETIEVEHGIGKCLNDLAECGVDSLVPCNS